MEKLEKVLKKLLNPDYIDEAKEIITKSNDIDNFIDMSDNKHNIFNLSLKFCMRLDRLKKELVENNKMEHKNTNYESSWYFSLN